MLKKAIIIALLALPVAIFAQDKLGHINSQEIISQMPERAKIEATIDTLQGQWENELTRMKEEYSGKIKEYQDKQATMSESIRQARISELSEMEQRIGTFQQQAYQDLQKKQQELIAPIIDKVKKAIDQVGTENGYTYIFDMGSQVILYKSPKSNDITPLVKKKLAL